MAAHNGLGLTVRDLGVGEAVNPRKVAGARLLHVQEKAAPAGHYLSLRLEVIAAGRRTTIWHDRVAYAALAPWKQVPFLTARAAAPAAEACPESSGDFGIRAATAATGYTANHLWPSRKSDLLPRLFPCYTLTIAALRNRTHEIHGRTNQRTL
ncbi:MAG: hypothetical protein HKL95_04840 [Phycisphaerae bacterium]|nr:hypothetical protein [Phycisphaerae bacterium]